MSSYKADCANVYEPYGETGDCPAYREHLNYSEELRKMSDWEELIKEADKYLRCLHE